MRKKQIPQISIFEFYCEHETGQQLKAISKQLDCWPQILELAASDLIDPKTKETGRNGLSVDTIVRATLLKQMMGLSYDELSFYLSDSISYRSFCRIDEKSPSRSCLQAGIVKLKAQTWEEINHLLLSDASQQKIEKGRTVRIDRNQYLKWTPDSGQ